MKNTRTKHTATFKPKVALEAVREHQSVPELRGRYGVLANKVYEWKRQFIERVALAFGSEAEPAASSDCEEESLKKDLGIKLENVTLSKDHSTI